MRAHCERRSIARSASTRAPSGLSEAILLSLAFSAKESFYKAVFAMVQRFIEFRAIEIDELDVARGRIGFTLTETLCDAWPCGKRWHAAFELIERQHVLTGVLW